MENPHAFLGGVLSALSFVIGLFFVRYYVVSRDRFFVFLTLTFWALGANWASLRLSADEGDQAYFYLPRLAAFVILLAGIADKNRRSAARRESPAGREDKSGSSGARR